MYGPLGLSPCGTLSPEPGWSSPCSTLDTLLPRFVSSVEKMPHPSKVDIKLTFQLSFLLFVKLREGEREGVGLGSSHLRIKLMTGIY